MDLTKTNMPVILRNDDINGIIEQQLSLWPLAKNNYDGLMNVCRKELQIGDLNIALQCNPARIVSTAAKTAKEDIEKRKCFLCRENRPCEQFALQIVPGWDLCINPYPVFPVHLTIISQSHRPQADVPEDIVKFAVALRGMTVFFNGAKAGASLPDHLHMQAVLTKELPLMQFVEKRHKPSMPHFVDSAALSNKLPFYFISGIVSPEKEDYKTLLAGLMTGGPSSDGTLTDRESVNSFFWIDSDSLLRFAVVPRKAHRPSCFYKDGYEKKLVSPGCIDMAGVFVLPRKEDFDSLDIPDITRIYSEVAL